MQALQNFHTVGKIVACDVKPVAKFECLEISGGYAANDGERYRLLVVSAGNGSGARGAGCKVLEVRPRTPGNALDS